jgi:acetate kinase
MKILTVNCGSSTVKYALFDMPQKRKLCYGVVDRVGSIGSRIEHVKLGERLVRRESCAHHAAALKRVMNCLTDSTWGVMHDLAEIGAVGHRVVHGGETFANPVLINNSVIKSIERLSELAILHNPINMAGIRAVSDLMPEVRWKAAVMGTRCGDLDPGTPLYVMRKEHLTPEEMESILNRQSGLVGIAETERPARNVERYGSG